MLDWLYGFLALFVGPLKWGSTKLYEQIQNMHTSSELLMEPPKLACYEEMRLKRQLFVLYYCGSLTKTFKRHFIKTTENCLFFLFFFFLSSISCHFTSPTSFEETDVQLNGLRAPAVIMLRWDVHEQFAASAQDGCVIVCCCRYVCVCVCFFLSLSWWR